VSSDGPRYQASLESPQVRRQTPSQVPVRIVGVGASAGGLDAFTQLLKVLPAESGMAFVLISHLSPTHRSELSRLLSPLTEMPVSDAVDGEVVRPDHVYVLPANRSLTIAVGHLHLAGRDVGDAHPSTIDQFLQSLAVDQGPRAVGVILSGTGSDGTAGLKAIQARGGKTYAEDPALAGFDGMPQSAVRAGAADFILSVADIGHAIAKLGLSPVPPEPEAVPAAGLDEAASEAATGQPEPAYSEAEAEALETIIQILQTATGVDFLHYRRPSLARRVRHRVDELGLDDFVAYLPRLRQDTDEVTALFDTVLIQVTGFFREPATFAALQDMVIPSLLTGRSGGTPIRAWVVGCATGQEAYSLAISFLEVEAVLGLEALIRVFASDLSSSGLAKARAGRYSRDESAALSPERLRQFLVPVDQGFQVTKGLREMCVFARHDLTRDPPFAQLDLVLCSNVLIYLDQVLQRRVLRNLHYALKPNGYLIMGPAETTASVEGLFSPVDRKLKIFLRRHAPTRPHVSFGETSARSRAAARPIPPLPMPPLQWSTAELQRAAEQVFFTDYPAASVIVNPDLEVLHFQGRTAPYLEAPTGGPTVKVLRLAHADLRLVLGRMFRRAKQDRAPVRRRGVRLNAGGKTRRVNLSVLPLPLGEAEEQHYLVVFDESTGPGEGRDAPDGVGAGMAAAGPSRTGASPAGSEGSLRVQALEAELAENKEYLQAIIDQQDATHAELQAAYEASLSVNEEFQSTNEELESAKEEMQSLNEELTTVNEQLHQRHAELEARTAELNTLLEAVDMPMLLLSRDLRLRAFNSRAAGDLHLTPTLVGHSLSDAHLPLPLSELRELTERAGRDHEVQERELQEVGGRWDALRVWPVQVSSDGGTVAVALMDITKLKGDVAEAAAARAYSEAIVESIMEPLVVLDDEFRVVQGNAAFHRVFAAEAGAVAGKRIAELGAGKWASADLLEFLERTRQSDRPVPGPDIALDLGGPGQRTFRLSTGVIGYPGARHLLLAMEDITARKAAEASEREASRMQAVGALAGGVAHEINNQMTAVLGLSDVLLKNAKDEDPQRGDLAIIVKAARRVADVTRQLLAFSRRQWLQPVVFDLNSVVAASETLLRRALGPDIALEISLGENVGQVQADQAQLEQILVNLSLNARDAMRGSGRLRIETTIVLVADPVLIAPGTETVPRGAYARLIVSDTGPGMDPVTQARIFEPFFTTKAAAQGTGLGLSSVYGTVKQSGGLIWVESEPGEGTTFTIDLPQVHAEPPVKPAPATGAAPGGTETILVVDDEEAVRAWICRSLRGLGYAVVEAGDAAEALLLAGEKQRPLDLVLSDVVMPGLDGVKLRARLAEMRPELPVLFMSGFVLEELVRQGRLDRESILLQKPFDLAALASEVRKALDSGRILSVGPSGTGSNRY
jgi:two-component system, chemotaxis family, CheB/CheR fusion protein